MLSDARRTPVRPGDAARSVFYLPMQDVESGAKPS